MIPSPPSLIAAAIAADLLLGDPRWFPHPVVGIGRLINLLENLLKHIRFDGYMAGTILCVLTVCITTAAATAILLLAYKIHYFIWWLSAICIGWTSVALRSLHHESRLVASALEEGDIESARRLLSNIVGRDTKDMDEEAIWRATVETVAENASDGVIAPILWLTVGGPVAALAYKAASTLDSMVGYNNERYARLGWASARLDDLLNLAPSRLTALFMVITAPTVGLSASNSWRIWRRDRRNHPSPNSGQPEAAAAGALKIRLGGPSSYSGKVKEKPFMGDPLLSCDSKAYHGMIRLMYATAGMAVIVCIVCTAIGRHYAL